MCGILGSIGLRPSAERWDQACLIQSRRGPDSAGEWRGRFCGGVTALAHQRLAIIDLSPAGAQPMVHPTSGSVLAFNGEIYNFVELRKELQQEGERFAGCSDTEVLLHALERWGVDRTLPKLNGMWAFAWVDVSADRVVLSRDRFGEKPLYVAASEQRTVFASDIRAILALEPVRRPLDRQSVASFFRLGVVNTGVRTIFNGIAQVPPGSFIEFRNGNTGKVPSPRRFWTCPVEAAKRSMPELIAEVRETLFDSVRIRMRSDVPVGLLLSGGLDSSAIAAAAHATGHGGLEMISLVSDDSAADESAHINAVAKHLGATVQLVRLPVDPGVILEQLGQVVDSVGMPVTSLSNVAHWILMREARSRGVKVVLSGQGGDEILCGYRKYLGFYLQALLREWRPLSAALVSLEFLINRSVLTQFNWSEADRYLPTPFRSGSGCLLGPVIRDEPVPYPGLLPNETVQARQRRDLAELSIPTLTHFEDRSSMAWSREMRLPFLDHRLVELLVPAPASLKLSKGWSKYPLRAAVADDLPAQIVWRRDKQGFATPEDVTLRKVLHHDFQQHFLRRDALVFAGGFLDFDSVSQAWERFSVGGTRSPWSRTFIQILSFELWLKYNSRYIG
jgi:asparagine synthase (glutamine-hydrolysing)